MATQFWGQNSPELPKIGTDRRFPAQFAKL